MTMVLGLDQPLDALVAAGNRACPACAGPLRRWGWARTRTVRGGGGEWRLRPARVRCRACGVTHVVLPPEVLVRRRDEVVVVGRAWRALAAGAGTRRVARALGVPNETVRGWSRRLRARAAPVPVEAASAPPPRQRGVSHLRRRLAALEAAARRAGWTAEEDLWRFASSCSQGLLLSNTS